MTEVADGREDVDSFAGYAVPSGRYRARKQRGPAYFVTLGIWVVVLMIQSVPYISTVLMSAIGTLPLPAKWLGDAPGAAGSRALAETLPRDEVAK